MFDLLSLSVSEQRQYPLCVLMSDEVLADEARDGRGAFGCWRRDGGQIVLQDGRTSRVVNVKRWLDADSVIPAVTPAVIGLAD